MFEITRQKLPGIIGIIIAIIAVIIAFDIILIVAPPIEYPPDSCNNVTNETVSLSHVNESWCIFRNGSYHNKMELTTYNLQNFIQS